jgi:hypothetical protein
MPDLPAAQANALAWNRGRAALERAIARHGNFAFETTLGGDTITLLLERAAQAGLAVRMWFVGLQSADEGRGPRPEPVLHVVRRTIVAPTDLRGTPRWARAIVAAAVKLARAHGSP